MKKLLLSAAAIVLGLTANAGTVTFDFTANDYGLPNDGDTYVTVPAAITSGDVTITLNSEINEQNGSTGWRMWSDGLREYNKQNPYFTVATTNGEKVTGVSWDVVSGATFALEGTTENITSWTGSQDVVTFVGTATANKAVKSITVTYGETVSEPTPDPEIPSAPEGTITVAEALALIADGYEGEATVKGVITKIQEISTSYGNATYFIADNANDESSLEIYRGYSLNGEKFTSEDEIAVGGTVVVSGKLVNYNGTYEFTTGSKILSYTAPSTEEAPALTSNIKDLTDGVTLSATAVVTAQSGRGLILTDNAGSIFYYNNNVDLTTYSIGTVVNVEGVVSVYGTGYQLSNSATISPVGTMSYTYPSPTVYTAEMIEAAIENSALNTATYISFEGELSIAGNYYNINIEGVTKGQGSLYTPTDALKELLENGSTYKFTGYYTGITSGKYFYMVLTDVELVKYEEPSGPEAPEGEITVAEALALIAEGYEGDATVKGVITEVKEISTSYGNATYFIADNAEDTAVLEVYRGYWMDGEKFTEEDQLKIGATVVVSGKLVNYNGTYEFTTGSKIISYDDSTTGIESIESSSNSSIEYYNLQGVRINNPIAGGLYIVRQNGKSSKVIVR